MPKLAKLLAKPTMKLIGEVGEALTKPAIPEVADRAGKTLPSAMEGAATTMGMHGRDVPFGSQPHLRSAVSSTEPVIEKSLGDLIQEGKTEIGSFFRPFPNQPRDVQAKLVEGLSRKDRARIQAQAKLEWIYAPFQENPVEKTIHSHRYLITSDEIAQALRDGRTKIYGHPIEDFMSKKAEYEQMVQTNPDMSEVLNRRQTTMKDMFDDMVNRGWIEQERYLDDYTHIRRVGGMVQGLARQSGGKLRSKYLSQMIDRTGPTPKLKRNADLLQVEGELIEEYLEKVSQHETFMELMDIPDINLSKFYQNGDRVADNHIAYHPGAGMFGYTAKGPEGEIAAGMAEELANRGGLSDIVLPGSYVVPKSFGKMLLEFNRTVGSTHGTENRLIGLGKAFARNLTVYNPGNTRLNQVSDVLQTMFGLPGEGTRILGVMRYGWSAHRAARKLASGKNSIVKINGQEVDVKALVENEGLGEATFYNEVKGKRISDEIARLYPEAERHQGFTILDPLHRDRYATELTPRLAAAFDEFAKSGNIKEAGRVGREITLHYGAGGPMASKMPMIKFLSPFLQFQGLATSRVYDMLRSPKSRNRTVLGLMTVPIVTWMWNTRNPEFQQVEDALSPFERDQAHVILPDFEDPSKPMRDIAGKPVVIRFRYWVPEEVMKMAGLGNIASRVHRAVRGRDTWGQFAASIPVNAGKTAVETLTMMPQAFSEIFNPEQSGGKQLEVPERVMRAFPLTRPFAVAGRRAIDYGPKEGALKFGQEMLGIREANLVRRGETLTDVDLLDARTKVKEARRAWQRAILNEGKTTQTEAEEKFRKAVENLERIASVVQKEQDNGQ